MSKKAFDKIAAGLDDVLADLRGEPGRVTRVHYPTPSIDVKAVRERQGMTQREFAAAYSIPLMTLTKWEQRLSEPTGPTRLLMHVIDRHPTVVRKVAKSLRSSGDKAA